MNQELATLRKTLMEEMQKDSSIGTALSRENGGPKYLMCHRPPIVYLFIQIVFGALESVFFELLGPN